jgi:molybdate transport system substrate-binding protein
MLDPDVKLGTSTPNADPSGDYAWEVFRRIENQRSGSLAVLDRKALKLTGGPATAASMASLSSGATRTCSSRTARTPASRPTKSQAAASLAVGADYGLTVMNGASPAAHRLTLTILSPDGKPSSPITGSALPPSPDRKADDQELRRQTARRYSRSLRIVE